MHTIRWAALGAVGVVLYAGAGAIAAAQTSVVGSEGSATESLTVNDCATAQPCHDAGIDKTHELKTSTEPTGGTIITVVNVIGSEPPPP